MRGKWSLVVVLLACHPPSKDRGGAQDDAAASVDAAAKTTAQPLPDVHTDWCTGGLLGLDEETCYLPPPSGDARPRRLLVYLHGIVPPQTGNSPQKENVMIAVKAASARAGAAALVPRGIRGIGPQGSKDWWAWPTSPEAHAAHAATLVARIEASKKKLEAVIGAPFTKTYLAGSSNGAYFAVNIALRDEIDVDGLGAMSGGAPSPIKRTKPLAVYVGYGKYDEPSKTGGLALAKAVEALKDKGWTSKVAEHPFPHGAREVYIDEAFAFWDSVP